MLVRGRVKTSTKIHGSTRAHTSVHRFLSLSLSISLSLSHTHTHTPCSLASLSFYLALCLWLSLSRALTVWMAWTVRKKSVFLFLFLSFPLYVSLSQCLSLSALSHRLNSLERAERISLGRVLQLVDPLSARLEPLESRKRSVLVNVVYLMIYGSG